VYYCSRKKIIYILIHSLLCLLFYSVHMPIPRTFYRHCYSSQSSRTHRILVGSIAVPLDSLEWLCYTFSCTFSSPQVVLIYLFIFLGNRKFWRTRRVKMDQNVICFLIVLCYISISLSLLRSWSSLLSEFNQILRTLLT